MPMNVVNTYANISPQALVYYDKHLLAFDVSKVSGAAYITIPQATKFIAADAFKGCGSVKAIVIPKYITFIDPTAFEGLSGIETIYYYGENVNAWNTLMNIPEGWGEKVLYRATKQPSENAKKYWHMVDRVPTLWSK